MITSSSPMISLDISCETAYTDGERIAFNPDFMDKLSDKELGLADGKEEA